jgi:hypothetical protein
MITSTIGHPSPTCPQKTCWTVRVKNEILYQCDTGVGAPEEQDIVNLAASGAAFGLVGPRGCKVECDAWDQIGQMPVRGKPEAQIVCVTRMAPLYTGKVFLLSFSQASTQQR